MPSTIRKLSVIDSAFLFGETTECPMHVGSTAIFRLPEGYDGDFFIDVRNLMMTRMEKAKVLMWKLSPAPFDIDRPSWIEDEQFDLDRHLYRGALPAPADRDTLMRLTGFLHAKSLSRSRPLWEMYVFDGLPNREVGVYTKMHHALIDGGAGAALAQVLYDLQPIAAPKNPPALQPPRARTDVGARDIGVSMMAAYASWLRNPFGDISNPSEFSLPRSGGNDIGSVLYDAAVHQIEWPIRLAQHSGEYAQAWNEAVQAALKPGALTALNEQFMAPPTPLNVAISSERTFAGTTIELNRVKALGKKAGATVNDIVLALSSGMLRRYLRATDGIPKQSLTAFVPISARTGGNDANNSVFGMITPLATNVENPKTRLQTIIKETATAKDLANPFKGIVPMMSDVPTFGSPIILQLMSTFWSRTRLANVVPPGVNVVVSNVLYSKVPFYLASAELVNVYPMSIPVHGQALNITVQGYCNQLDFGLTAAANVLPDLSGMISGLHKEMKALEGAFGVA